MMSFQKVRQYQKDVLHFRPESYREDVHTVDQTPHREAEDVYSNLASAAESGWDFSSRWFSADYNNEQDKSLWLGYTDIVNVAPVDLNSILCWNEALLSKFYNIAGSYPVERYHL